MFTATEIEVDYVTSTNEMFVKQVDNLEYPKYNDLTYVVKSALSVIDKPT